VETNLEAIHWVHTVLKRGELVFSNYKIVVFFSTITVSAFPGVHRDSFFVFCYSGFKDSTTTVAVILLVLQIQFACHGERFWIDDFWFSVILDSRIVQQQ
jgi:hypothetical protein